MDIPNDIFPKYKGKLIIPSRHAQDELGKFGLDLWDIKEVLEIGYDRQTGRRKREIIERCLEKDNHNALYYPALKGWVCLEALCSSNRPISLPSYRLSSQP